MNSSATIGALAAALAKAQAEMKPAVKDSKNPFFKSNYADLSSVWESIREPLSKNGLSVLQTTGTGEMGLTLTTILAHSSGEWIKSDYPINPTKNDPQGVGSAVTYARRYSVAALVGVCTEDDDGEAATDRSKAAPPLPARKEQFTAPLAQAKDLLLGGSTSEQYSQVLDADPGSQKDYSKYKYRYHIPYKKEGKDMDEVRSWMKKKGFDFNPDDKHWYGNLLVEKIQDYLRPLPGAAPLDVTTDEIPEFNYGEE